MTALRYCLKLFIPFILFPFLTEAQGLKFNGNEKLIDERTSYTVFANSSPMFKDLLDLSFDISFPGPSDIGYIFRMMSKESAESYNFFLNGITDSIQFKFNIEGKQSLITANLKKEDVRNNRLPIRLLFNLKEGSLSLTINRSTYFAKGLPVINEIRPMLFFGKSDYFIDVPSITIKNLVIKDRSTQYTFRFDENKGNIVHDTKGNKVGEIHNASWLIDESYYWKLKKAFYSKTIAGVNYNEEKQSIYYFNKDSIIIYSLSEEKVRKIRSESPCPLSLNLATNFIYPPDNTLYAYEIAPTEPEGKNMASLDLENYQWKTMETHQFPMQLHHHAIAFDPGAKQYFLFGGFGNQHYSNKLYRFDLNTKAWSELPLSGDFISPRYFSSMGYHAGTHSLYIFGGMGNESGEQIVGRRYYYDLYRIDLKTFKVSKLWEIPWESDNMVPTRSLIMTDDTTFYTLCYPEHFSDSHLKLYQFSVRDGSYSLKGDSIPIHSEKIKTNACLYYNSRHSLLYAIVQEFANDDIASDVKIYSLNFPPVALSELNRYATAPKEKNIFLKPNGLSRAVTFGIAAGFLAFLLLSLYYARRRMKRIKSHAASGKSEFRNLHPEAVANAIFLFGKFTVKDKDGKDITYLFSPKLKQLFLVFLEYSGQGGITSTELNQIFWPDKAESKVKNSRGVTISNLRKILEELEGIKLVYEKGLFKIVATSGCYCDYFRLLSIKESPDTGSAFQEELAEIISKGKFLQDINYAEVDKFKGTVEQLLLPILLIEMEETFREEQYEATIIFANAMLNIDPVNETAFEYLIHSLQKTNSHNEAKKRSIRFIADYKQIMGEEYIRKKQERPL